VREKRGVIFEIVKERVLLIGCQGIAQKLTLVPRFPCAEAVSSTKIYYRSQ
jgi:hypothetical protein